MPIKTEEYTPGSTVQSSNLEPTKSTNSSGGIKIE